MMTYKFEKQEPAASIFRAESERYGDSRFFRNADDYLPHYTASQVYSCILKMEATWSF
jgi:hypothetical protein